MLDSKDLLMSIKKAAVEAMDASKPVSFVFGKVISASPLKINIEQKMTLTTSQLILSRNVTDYNVFMSVDHQTESGAESINLTHKYSFSGDTEDSLNSFSIKHSHSYKGKKQFTVHNSLVVGDEVILLRMQGGQKYIVLDRIGT